MMLNSACAKRNSKLESHLKRSLPRHVYDDIRYYESCVVKHANEALSFQYVILTGKAVLLADYPFRGVKEAVRLNDVLSIKVELDFPPFLNATEGHNCQHIRLSCRSSSSEFQSMQLQIVKEENEEAEASCSSITTGQLYSEDFIEEIPNEEVVRSSDGESHAMLTAIASESSGKVHTGESSNVSSSAKFIKFKKRDLSQKEKYELNEQLSNEKLSDEVASKERTYNSNISESFVNSDLLQERMKGQIPVTRISAEKSSIATADCITAARSQSATPQPYERSISSLLRRVQYSQPRPSRSFSSMGHYTKTTSPLPVPIPEKRSRSVMEKPRRHINSRNLEWSDEDSPQQFDDMHIYVLQAKAILLNHLQTNWHTYLINKTLQISNPSLLFSEVNDSSQLENLYYKFKSEVFNSENSLENTYSLLNELLVGFQQRSQLKFIFWKDQMLYHFVMQKLDQYMLSSQHKKTFSLSSFSTEMDSDVYIQERQDELEIIIMLLDILSAVFHDTDNVHDKMKMLHFHNGTLIRQLLVTIIPAPSISSKFYSSCSRMLEGFNEFSTYAWRNLPEAVLIELIGTVTNKVCGILSEIMSTIRQSRDNNSHISISTLFKDISMENYLKRSITQLLGFLFSTEQQFLTPEESVIVYHHFFVLKCLMDNLPEVHVYVGEHYQEEFRYYFMWSRINCKIPDTYPIKRILRPLVEYTQKMASYEKPDKTLYLRKS